MIQRFIDHMRSQPRSKRDSYALSGAALCTGMIALVWLLQGPSFLGAPSQQAAAPLAQTQDRSAPFSTFMSQMREITSQAFDRSDDPSQFVLPESDVGAASTGESEITQDGTGLGAAGTTTATSATSTEYRERSIQIATSTNWQ